MAQSAGTAEYTNCISAVGVFNIYVYEKEFAIK